MSPAAACLAGSVLILLTALARPLLLRLLPKCPLPALWLTAALRLLLPFSLPLGLEPGFGLAQAAEALQGTATAAGPAGAVERAGAPVLLAVWALGAAALLLWFALRYARCLRVFRRARRCEDEFVRGWLRLHPLRRRLEVRVSEGLTTPLTYGLLRPVILLPAALEAGPQEALEYALLHEYVHVRRLDALAKPLFSLCLCLYWFDPLVWLMHELAGRDMELACDEAVLRRSGWRASDYALSLIALAGRGAAPPSPASGLAGSAMEERIRQLMRYKKRSLTAAVAAVLVIVLAAGAALLSADSRAGVRQLWSDTAAFAGLGPGEEQCFPGFVSVTGDGAGAQYVLSYSRSGVGLELGLRDAQGAEYSVSVRGGGGSGDLGRLPAGEYTLFVRNTESAAALTDGADAENYSATGAAGIILND